MPGWESIWIDLRDLLWKYMNVEQRLLMEILDKNKLPLLKYHNEKVRHGLREHIATIGKVFKTS